MAGVPYFPVTLPSRTVVGNLSAQPGEAQAVPIFALSSQLADASTITFTPAGTGAVARTVQSKERDIISIFDFGAVGGGVVDDSTAFTNAALASATATILVPYITGGYKIAIPFVIPANGSFLGLGGPTLSATVNGTHIASATGVAGVTVSGIKFVGTSASTAPLSGFGGFSANNTGLLCISNCTDVRIEDCEFSTFYNTLTVQGCTRLWVRNNKCSTFLTNGILASQSASYDIDRNDISSCTQSGGVVAYGIQATGDDAGGKPEKVCSISFNRITGIQSWFGIASHDANGMRIVGNDIRDVRGGVSVGHFVSTNIVKNIHVTDNYIESTATDTWAAASSAINGIEIAGFDATHRLSGAVVSGNILRDFFTVAAMAGTTNSAGISIQHSDDTVVSDNRGFNFGNKAQSTGVFVTGTCNRLGINDNSFQGQMPRGGVRLSAVTSDVASITGNSTIQTSAADPGVLISTSTITSLACGLNPTNSTAAYDDTGSTITSYVGGQISGQFTVTLTGCTTSPTATAIFSVVGDTVTLLLAGVSATSNTAAATLTGMPAKLFPKSAQPCIGVCIDNGVTAISKIQVETSGVLTLFFGIGGFTAAGTKGVSGCTITYERNG